ncbi:hypothetical protein [uncultured Pseudomonas sp.]|uniref:hypothetical protein n=1 Tax=uncultured Pseudomonas sp. TaxID=114707 RepID=UPI0026264222|nr:hypothetical protein [uncultured Pseudomonas sp.]
MADIIKHKRSATAAAVPAAGQLSLGELAINTADGKVYLKKSDGSVVLLGADKEGAIAAGTTAQYWRGDKTWQDLPTAVRAALLTGLSTASSADVAATDTVLAAIGKLQATASRLQLEKVARSGFVGTVSQLAGVPTGAIIERGSNANGSYVRYADGTQICAALTPSMSASTTGVRTETFPAVFIATPFVVVTPTGVARAAASEANDVLYDATTTTCVIASGRGVSTPFTYMAFGRWF